MQQYKDIYEFASSAGALEGYVYFRKKEEVAGLDIWVKNLVKQYDNLPADVRESFQGSLDRTLGRAIQSLISMFGEDHDNVKALRGLVKGEMPASADDFEREKKEKAKMHE